MPTRLSRTSACCRRFAGREALTVDVTFAGALRALPPELKKRSILPRQVYWFAGGIAVADALVFELMGLAMLALCIVVLAVPSGRRPARHIGDA
jgi:hypothetical protein